MNEPRKESLAALLAWFSSLGLTKVETILSAQVSALLFRMHLGNVACDDLDAHGYIVTGLDYGRRIAFTEKTKEFLRKSWVAPSHD